MGTPISVTVLATAFLLLLPTARAQEDELVRLYGEARSAEAAGDYPGAAQRYERIVVLRPDMAEAHVNLGNLYYVQGRLDRAEISLKKALQLKAGLFAPHLLLGILYFNARNFTLAMPHLMAAVKLDSSNAMGQLYLGYTLYALARHADSAAALEKAVQLDETSQDAWYHLSIVYGQLSKRSFELLQKQHAGALETHLARTHFFEASSSWEQAQAELSLALAQQPGNERLRQRKDWLAQRAAGQTSAPPADSEEGSTRYLYAPPSGRNIQSALTEERRAVQEAAKIAPPSKQSLYLLAEGYQALSFLSSLWILQTDPDSYRAHQLRGQSNEAAGRVEEAISEYREALKRKPELQTIHFAIGNLYWRNSRLDEARPELEAELKLNPRDAQAHFELGDILFSNGETAAAEKHFAESIRYAPSMPEAHLSLARIATANGNFTKALTHLKKAAEISPKDSTPHYRMWLLYKRLGKTVEAESARKAFEERKKPGQ
jgi:tetratricopeptide (TPR) repeat protein